MLKEDIRRTYDFARGSKLKKTLSCLRSPGVHAVVVLRFGQWLRKKGLLLRILLTPFYVVGHYFVATRWGIDIARDVKIGAGLYIGHFGGIIIGANVEMGINATISQGVTLGVAGQAEKRGSPRIGDNVYIAPGAKVFGQIQIGDNVKIGANAVIFKDIPSNSVCVLSPGFVIIPQAAELPPEVISAAGD